MSLIFAILIMLFIGFSILAITSDKKEWNRGKCPVCDLKWRLFDVDSQGGRGYTCDKCDKTIWISYPVDKEVK